MPERNLRLLSLDGGGVRGLSSLIILQQLMSTINRDHPPKPCDYFDLIGGTSTGGIIALMLGRLRMGVDECIDAYVALSDNVFKKRRHRLTLKGKIQGRFDKLALEKAIKLVLVEHGFNEDELLRDNSDSVCKVAVYATCKETGDVVCFKSYQATSVNSHLFNSTKIWEACRATSAATSFFDPITIGPFGESFVDAAAVGVNNPVYSVWNEAQEIWGADHLAENLNCFISIGTGMPGLKPFRDTIFHISKTLAAIATETEKTAERFRCDKFKLAEDGLYYRFSVMKGLETVGLQEAVKKAEIAAVTLRYIQSQEVFRQFGACVLRMSKTSPVESNTSISAQVPHGLLQTDFPPRADEPTTIDRPAERSQEFQGSLSLAGVPITQNFVPRSADTAEMEQVLLSDRRFSEQTVYVLHGLGGMGKTTLAADFVRKHHTKFSAVFWLDGRTEQNLKRSIAMCAIRIPDQAISEQSRKDLSHGDVSVDVVLTRVMSWLEQSGNSSWLLIFDNVNKDAHNQDEDDYDLSRYFPASHGSILVTTRLSRLAQLGSSGRLDKAKDVEARSIFEKWYGSELCDVNIDRLLRELDGLPLAVAQAAAYLRETDMKFADYLLYYKKQWKDLMEYQGASILYHANRNIATTWLISLRTIQAKNPDSINLLRVWAFLDNKSMFYGLLSGAAKASSNVFPEWLRALATDKLKFIEATRLLLSHSMIEMIQGDSVCYSVHPVVHRCAAEVDLTKPEQLEFLKTAISLVGLAVPETKNSDYWTVSRKLLPHATFCSQLLLSAQDRLGEKVEASYGHQPTDDLQSTEGKIEISPIAEAAHRLADFHRTHGNLLLAYDLYKYTLESKKSTGGPKHLSTLDTVNNLGVLCQGLGKLDEAESMCVEALQGREELLGPDHMATLGSANNLALVYLDKDKLEQAENLFRRAFKTRVEVLGLTHLYTLRVWANLGLVYTKKGDFNEAEATLQQVLKGYEMTIGPDHTYTLRVVNSLGHIFEDQGRLAEAEEMYMRTLAGRRTNIGPDHILTLHTINDLGHLYLRQGKLDKAEENLKVVMEARIRVLGPDNESTTESVVDLVMFYLDHNRLEEALCLTKKAKARMKRLKEQLEESIIAPDSRVGEEEKKKMLSLLGHEDTTDNAVSDSISASQEQEGGYYREYLQSFCRRRGWPDPAYECYKDASGYSCLVLVNGREYTTDLTYGSPALAMENAAMRAFMIVRNFSLNGAMLARNGIIQGLPAIKYGRRKKPGQSLLHTQSPYRGARRTRRRRLGSRGNHSSSSSEAASSVSSLVSNKSENSMVML